MVFSADCRLITLKLNIMLTLKMPSKFKSSVAKFMMSLISVMASIVAFAQDKTVDVNINSDKGGGNFFASPWVWVVGVAVFILLLVALMRGGGRKDA